MESEKIIANTPNHTRSLWMDIEAPQLPLLDEDLNVDVCIVGAGITGLTSAYTLTKQGKSIAIIDQNIFEGGESARTTAHLSWALDDRYYSLEHFFGQKGAQLAAESHAAAIDYIEKIVTEEGIDCDFARVDGFLFNAPQSSLNDLEKEYQAVQRTGKEITKVSSSLFGSAYESGPSLQFPRQAQFHVLKYLQGLIKAVLKNGGNIFNHTHATHFEDGSECIVKTGNEKKIIAKSVIVATCTPINDRFYIHTKQSAYRTYVIAASIPKGSVPKALYWDTADPYHYVRTQPHLSDSNFEWLIIGGEDHKTGQEHDIQSKYDHLEAWAKERFPMIKSVEYHWSGQVFEPIDSLAFIGRNPGDKNTFIVTGDSGNGMTHGTIAGILLPDLIAGKTNPWTDLYNPSRKTISAAYEFLQENANVAMQYTDWFTSGEHKAINELPLDEGIIVRKGLKKIAIYKDAQNNIHIKSAFCPHLGGCVRWNPGEKTWDCPCHGSRFSGCGKVITGPAISDLSPLAEDVTT